MDVGTSANGSDAEAEQFPALLASLGSIRDDPETDLALGRLLRSAAALGGLAPERFFVEFEAVVGELFGGEPVSVDLRRRIARFAYIATAAAAYCGAQLAEAIEGGDFAEGLRELERLIEDSIAGRGWAERS